MWLFGVVLVVMGLSWGCHVGRGDAVLLWRDCGVGGWLRKAVDRGKEMLVEPKMQRRGRET